MSKRYWSPVVMGLKGVGSGPWLPMFWDDRRFFMLCLMIPSVRHGVAQGKLLSAVLFQVPLLMEVKSIYQATYYHQV